MSEVKLTEEQSMQQAQVLKLINDLSMDLDADYLFAVAKATREQARMQETMIIFAPMHPMDKIKALYAKADAIDAIASYVNNVKKASEYEAKAAIEISNSEQIKALFF